MTWSQTVYNETKQIVHWMEESNDTELQDKLINIFHSNELFIKGKTGDFYPISFLLGLATCLILILSCLVYIIKTKLYQKSASYILLTNMFILDIFLSLSLCLEVFSSYLNKESMFYLEKNSLTCFINNFFVSFLVLGEHLQLFLIWLILLSERGIINMKCLNSDFILKNSNQVSLEANVLNNELTAYIEQIKVKNWKNRLILNSRLITLCFFYTFSFLIALYAAQLGVEDFLFPIVCHTTVFLFNLGYFTLYFIYFTTAVFLIPAIVFWNLFGGKCDPLKNNMSQAEINHLKFIKMVSMLRAFEELLYSAHAQLWQYVSFNEAIYFLSIVITTIIAIMFLKYENVFEELRTARPKSNQSESLSNIYKRRDDETESFDYKNLIENSY